MLIGVTALLSEAAARTGAGLLPFIRPRSAKGSATGAGLERFGLGLLLGWAALGFIYFGLALASLFTPLVLASCALALLCGSRAMWERRLMLVVAAVEGRALGIGGLSALALGIVPVVFYFFLPEGHIDVWVYHLGMPWQYLQSGRAVLEHVPMSFQFPMTVEMTFALPLIAGDDRLAKGMLISCFAAASAVFAAQCLKKDRPMAAWLGPLLALSSTYMLIQIMVCKSDVPASALFVTGALMQLSGGWAIGAALLGLCVVSKLAYGPLVAVWGLCFLPPRKHFGWWVVLLVLPFIPWLAKNWLTTGTPNPVYTFAPTGLFPIFEWTDLNREVFRSYLRTLLVDGPLQLAALPEAWFTLLRQAELPVLLFLPGLLALSRCRRAAWACVVGQLVVLKVGHFDRYILPTTWLISLLIAQEAGRFPMHFRRAIGVVLGIYVLLRIGLDPATMGIHRYWQDTFSPWSEVLKRHYTTFVDVERILMNFGVRAVSWRPGALRPARVLNVGDARTYKFPGQMIYNGMFGETPVVWKMVTESKNLDELRKKFRQLGAQRLLYNYVSVDWSFPHYGPFQWDQRTLRLYVDFCKQYLVVLGQTKQCDYRNGGFYIFRVLAHPLNPPAADVLFMPGAESVLARTTALTNGGRLREALREALTILKVVPEVAHVWNTVGHIYLKMRDYPNAYKYLKRFGEVNTMDALNLLDFGTAASQIGRLDIAERMLQEAFQRYPDERDVTRVNLAQLYVQRAARLGNRRQFDIARDLLNQAEELLLLIPEDKAQVRVARRYNLAGIMVLRGDFCAHLGEKRRAASYYRTACRISPEHELVPRWKALADALDPRTLSFGR